MSIIQQIVTDQIIQACWIIRHLHQVKPVLLNKFNKQLAKALESIAQNINFISESEIADSLARKKIKDIYHLLTQPRDEEVFHEFSQVGKDDKASYRVLTHTGWGAKCRFEFIQLIDKTKYPKRLAKKWVKEMKKQFRFYFKDELLQFIGIGEERNPCFVDSVA